jgi:3alpha(or 20beta)-hydroxysteroid dehydrogenase
MPRLTGKVAIVTGAARGIGLSTAQIFAAEGAKVVLADISEEALKSATQEILATGGEALAHTLDVTSPESWKQLVADVVAEWGTIDILVNNAGIAIPKALLDTTIEEWDRVLAVNSTGPWLGMQNVIPVMQAAGSGSIVNLSSIAALVSGAGDGGAASYSASKGAVRSLTKHAAFTFAKDGIRVNSVHPGPVYTAMIQKYGLTKEEVADPANSILPPHVGEPSDIGYGILYLASDEAKFVTGAELVIDGGFTAH